MGQTRAITSVLSALKQIEDEILKDQKSKTDKEWVKGWSGVLNRVRFIKSILTIINILQSIDATEKLDEKIHQSFQHAR